MNSKAQFGIAVLLGFMLMVTIVVLALGLAFPIRQGSNNAMDSMNCSNSSIPDSTRAGCYVADINPFFFVGILMAIGGIVVAARIIYG